MNAVGSGVSHIDNTAAYKNIIITADAVLLLSADIEHSVALHHNLSFTEKRGFHVLVSASGVFSTIGNSVDRSIGKSQRRLLSRLYVDCRAIVVCKRKSIECQFEFLVTIYFKHTVGRFAAQHILQLVGSCRCHHHIVAVDSDAHSLKSLRIQHLYAVAAVCNLYLVGDSAKIEAVGFCHRQRVFITANRHKHLTGVSTETNAVYLFCRNAERPAVAERKIYRVAGGYAAGCCHHRQYH